MLDITKLTLNPIEQAEFSKFVYEKTLGLPELGSLHTVWSGVKMEEQIVIAGNLGATGVKAGTTCARVSSGAAIAFSEKKWAPASIEDTFTICQKSINPLFKAYYGKINSYKERYDISGSDEMTFLLSKVTESLKESTLRYIWYGDKNVATASASTSGLISSGDTKLFDAVNGIWQQVFSGVTANEIERVTISYNSGSTLQTLPAGESVKIFDSILDKAPIELKYADGVKFMVDGKTFKNYTNYLKSVGENFTIQYTLEGFAEVTYDGYKVVNMEKIWDKTNQFFVRDTTNNLPYLPYRVVFTHQDNIPVATLNTNDIESVETLYREYERENIISWGYNIDAKVVVNSEIVVAY